MLYYHIFYVQNLKNWFFALTQRQLSLQEGYVHSLKHNLEIY